MTLPYPVSANIYWRTRVIKNFVSTYVSSEAKAYKAEVGGLAKAAGIRKPMQGRVSIDIRLYPARPADWMKRAQKSPLSWDDSVRCVDLDNANKVLLDALKGVVIEDDRWVRRLTSERMEPDGGEARVVVTVRKLAVDSPQATLL